MQSAALLALFLLLFGHPLAAQSAPVDSSRLVRVLTFNILHGATTRGDFDLDRIARVIREADPDLVALQEVDYKTRRARGYDLVTELGWRSGLQALFGRAMPYDGGEYGEGVLSRHSLVASRNVPLPHSPGHEPRAALEIVTVLPAGDTIAFVGTHLDHPAAPNDRLAQARRLNAVFTANPYPTLLAGDLNDLPDSAPIATLEREWTATYDRRAPAPTYPSGGPTKKIDYVMFRPANRWRVVETRVIDDAVASDHCAYLVVLELLAADGAVPEK